MTVWGWRAIATGGSVVVGAAAAVVTTMVTDQPSVPLWVGLAALVVVLAVLHGWLTLSQGSQPTRRRTGAGSVVVGKSSSAPITTDVSGVRRVSGAAAGSDDEVGSGAVVVNGDSTGEIRTRVRDVEER